MTAKRFNAGKVVDVKFAALSNKEFRSLRRWLIFHEKSFPFISRNKFHWLLATYTNKEVHNDVKLLPKPYVWKLMVSYGFLDSL